MIRPNKVAQILAHAGVDLTKTTSINSANLPVNMVVLTRNRRSVLIKLPGDGYVDSRIKLWFLYGIYSVLYIRLLCTNLYIAVFNYG